MPVWVGDQLKFSFVLIYITEYLNKNWRENETNKMTFGSFSPLSVSGVPLVEVFKCLSLILD